MRRRLWRLFIDLVHHFFWGSICVLRRGHLRLVAIGEIGKKGFRGVPAFQCARCKMIFVKDRDALRLGGRVTL